MSDYIVPKNLEISSGPSGVIITGEELAEFMGEDYSLSSGQFTMAANVAAEYIENVLQYSIRKRQIIATFTDFKYQIEIWLPWGLASDVELLNMDGSAPLEIEFQIITLYKNVKALFSTELPEAFKIQYTVGEGENFSTSVKFAALTAGVSIFDGKVNDDTKNTVLSILNDYDLSGYLISLPMGLNR